MASHHVDPQLDRLHARGERLTPQRLAVLDAVRVGGHQTADAIYARVRALHPYVNRATIYRTLAWLRDQGLLAETDLGGGQAVYQYLQVEHHHHLVCLHCGVQQQFPDELVTPLSAALHERYGFAPRIDHLAVFGLCRDCLVAEGAALHATTGVSVSDARAHAS